MSQNDSFNYDICSSGLLLPIGTVGMWNRGVVAFIYLAAMSYCFIGMAIVNNLFMESVAKMTSKTKKVSNRSYKFERTVERTARIWYQPFVTTMSSSTPIIFLCIIEVLSKNFEAGDFGPGVVVGSAAVNLFLLTAVCILVVPNGESRRIINIEVFIITAVFSTISYFWLLFITALISPSIVEFWEAAITLGLFPIFLIASWLAETHFWHTSSRISNRIELVDGIVAQRDKQVGLMYGSRLVSYINEIGRHPDITDDDVVTIALNLYEESRSRSRLWYRIKAIQNVTGNRQNNHEMTEKLRKIYDAVNDTNTTPTAEDPSQIISQKSPSQNSTVIEFQSGSCVVNRNAGKIPFLICRSGKLDASNCVRVLSSDGTAVENVDYKKINESVMFEAGDTTKEIFVEIVEDSVGKSDKEFYLKISLPDEKQPEFQLSPSSIMKIIISYSDEPEEFTFEQQSVIFHRSKFVEKVEIAVSRNKAAHGDASVRWTTFDRTAKSGRDYNGGEGLLHFKHMENSKNIVIPIIAGDLTEKDDPVFEVELFDPTAGTRLGSINKTAVTIVSDDSFKRNMSRIMHIIEQNIDAQNSQSSYLANIKNAIQVNGGNKATIVDYIMHVITFGWKMLFALFPPPHLLCGLPALLVSLVAIIIITTLVFDLAFIFGCITESNGAATAVVSLGFCIPDILAARLAIIRERHADCAIGGIMASNASNVFLGLGLPWLAAAIYHVVNANHFWMLPRDTLISVILFHLLFIVFIILLIIRRFTGLKGWFELGGHKLKFAFCAVILWFTYVIGYTQTHEIFQRLNF